MGGERGGGGCQKEREREMGGGKEVCVGERERGRERERGNERVREKEGDVFYAFNKAKFSSLSLLTKKRLSFVE